MKCNIVDREKLYTYAYEILKIIKINASVVNPICSSDNRTTIKDNTIPTI